MAGLLYFKFGTQKSGIDHYFAPYVRDLVPDTWMRATVASRCHHQHQLSHYANGIKKPRPEQRRRIVEGLHKIGRELIAVE